MTTTPDTDPAAKVRQLLLSGDNLIKNRDSPERFDRARTRYTEARELAVAQNLEPLIIEIIDRRIETLPPADGGAQ